MDLKSISFSLCILLSTYLTFLCGQPPNPTPYNSTSRDSMSAAVSPSSLFIRGFVDVFLGICHALLCLTYQNPPQLLCPNSSYLAPHLYGWTFYSAGYIAVILLGCYFRLSSFATLGSNFTFRLKAPSNLITSGIYSYVQHPSYTGKALIIIGNWALIQRRDGTLGCWLPGWIVEAQFFWIALACFLAFGAGHVAWKRVKDEEVMLKSIFGEEWEVWHAKTKRFIPGLF